MHISAYEGEVIITDITKHYPPDTAAAFIWLKNRQGWRDKQELEHSGQITFKGEIIFVGSDEDGES